VPLVCHSTAKEEKHPAFNVITTRKTKLGFLAEI
jgi:hypothetical protein